VERVCSAEKALEDHLNAAAVAGAAGVDGDSPEEEEDVAAVVAGVRAPRSNGAGALACDASWRRGLLEVFGRSIEGDLAPVGEQLKKTAGELCKLLRIALKRRIGSIRKKGVADSFVWPMMESNLPTLAAIIASLQHCKPFDELRRVSATESFFVADLSKFRSIVDTPGLRTAALQGCYLYYDRKRGFFVRAGTVVRQSGDGVVVRTVEHGTASRKHQQQLKSRFYGSYINGTQASGSEHRRIGSWADLQPFIGCAVEFEHIAKASSLFYWSTVAKAKMESQAWGGKDAGPAIRQRRLVGYMLECAYGLMLSDSLRISDAPSFEAPTGYYNV
jgi:hypothetical protein